MVCLDHQLSFSLEKKQFIPSKLGRSCRRGSCFVFLWDHRGLLPLISQGCYSATQWVPTSPTCLLKKKKKKEPDRIPNALGQGNRHTTRYQISVTEKKKKDVTYSFSHLSRTIDFPAYPKQQRNPGHRSGTCARRPPGAAGRPTARTVPALWYRPPAQRPGASPCAPAPRRLPWKLVSEALCGNFPQRKGWPVGDITAR